MIRIAASALLAASPAMAQVAPISFETGKALQLAPGQWSYVATATGSEARFGTQFSLRCDRTTRVVTISSLVQPSAPITIATSSVTKDISVGGRLTASDPLLDAIAFSRGRILVRAGTGPLMALPSWPEAARSIEDCRI
jgi:hypothetical protein